MPIVCRREADRTDARSRRPPLAVLFAAVLLLTVGSLPSGAAESAAPGPTYVGSAACAGCHAGECGGVARLAARPRDAGRRRGHRPRRLRRRQLRLRRRHLHASSAATASYWVSTDGPDGKPADFEIRYTFGVYPLQQYLIGFPGRPPAGARHRLGRAARRSRAGSAGSTSTRPSTSPPGNPLHWTGRDQNWNYMCAECHSTDAARRTTTPPADRYRDELVRDPRRLRGLPRPGLGARRLGRPARRSAGRATTGLTRPPRRARRT